jgi:hypothetical protein
MTLRDRLAHLEDLLAVHETIAGYGLTIDGGTPLEGGRLWTEDCVYDSDAKGADGGYRTRAGIESLIAGARDAAMGFAHITHLPIVAVEGATASAFATSHLLVADDGADFKINRVSANQWQLVRVDERWQMRRRTSRTLDGSGPSKEIYAEGARLIARQQVEAKGPQAEVSNPEEEHMESDELADLARRIGELEDKFEILQVIAGYGPSVDGGAAREAGMLWTENSWYDTDSSPAAATPHGRLGIENAAKRFLEDPVGLAHISHLPLIKVEGDHATAVNHSNTFHQEGDTFRVGRVSSNRWYFCRVDGKWQIERRVNRLLTGSPESKDVLAEGTRAVLGTDGTSAGSMEVADRTES